MAEVVKKIRLRMPADEVKGVIQPKYNPESASNQSYYKDGAQWLVEADFSEEVAKILRSTTGVPDTQGRDTFKYPDVTTVE